MEQVYTYNISSATAKGCHMRPCTIYKILNMQREYFSCKLAALSLMCL